MSADLSSAQKRALAAIERAAEAGEPCPSNNDLADLLGHASPSAGSDIVRELEALGLILVERFQQARRVTILATGRVTAYRGRGVPHWRLREDRVPIGEQCAAEARNREARLKIASKFGGGNTNVLDPLDPGPVLRFQPKGEDRRRFVAGREPCPRCGTRADIGCRHQRLDPPVHGAHA